MSTRVEGRNVQTSPGNLQNVANATAGAAQSFNAANALTPNAQKRVVALTNNSAQQATVTVSPYLAAAGPSSGVSSGNITVPAEANGTPGVAYVTVAQLSSLADPWDSIQIAVNYATLPATGTGISTVISELI